MEQQITPETRPLLPVVMTAMSTSNCAWCLGEQGIVPLTGSHGMCKRHEAQMLAQYRAIRAAKQALKGVTTV